MLSSEEIVKLGEIFGIADACGNCVKFIDTTKGEDDVRWNYNLDGRFFLKVNTKGVNERFLEDISLLISRYRSIDVYCPSFKRTLEGNLTYSFEHQGLHFTAYVETLAPYPLWTQHDSVDYGLKAKVVPHLGRLAARYTNMDLSQTRSMWSIIDLSPFDSEIDEKQENLDDLETCLNEGGYQDLARRLTEINGQARGRIKACLSDLPRCVYQGDLNSSNILVSDDPDYTFKGLIDFNLAGTEVNINCFLNECMYFLEAGDFDELSSQQIFDKMRGIQGTLLAGPLSHYTLNAMEQSVFKDYEIIIFMSFYPNVTLFIKLIKEGRHVEKVLGLLECTCDYYLK